MIEPSMQIDAYAHIVPPRFAERVERHLERHGVPERIKLFDPWLHEDEVLIDLDARKRDVPHGVRRGDSGEADQHRVCRSRGPARRA